MTISGQEAGLKMSTIFSFPEYYDLAGKGKQDLMIIINSGDLFYTIIIIMHNLHIND